ncbi:MAG: tyrosyl-tRNA synthetase, partial [Patescibacteria group bacterium]|nr:tyrosyl-tRNA synthetase [Patescibacteria group bacterium]
MFFVVSGVGHDIKLCFAQEIAYCIFIYNNTQNIFLYIQKVCYIVLCNKPMAVDINEEKIQNLLTRNVEEVFVKEDFEKELRSGKELRIKLGIDPTGPKIHLGRAIPLRKLREFQKMGHKIVLVIGDFTAQIGDASDKTEKRPFLTRLQIDDNLKDYKNQIGKIIDLSKTEIVYNSDWLSKLTFREITELAEIFTVQQMLARRNFSDRYDEGIEISLREFLYPLMQGYDSHAIKSDAEIGGFDQLFNLKAGRDIQDYYNEKKQSIMNLEMLEGTDGRKMSTSWGNIITIVDEPSDMFGKIMSMKDELILKYFRLCTDKTIEEIKVYEERLKSENPKDIKMELGEEIVKLYHSEKLAKQAKQNFIEVFQNKGLPDQIPEIVAAEGDLYSDVVVKSKIVESKAEWKRLVEQNAILKEDDTVITDYKAKAENGIIKI